MITIVSHLTGTEDITLNPASMDFAKKFARHLLEEKSFELAVDHNGNFRLNLKDDQLRDFHMKYYAADAISFSGPQHEIENVLRSFY